MTTHEHQWTTTVATGTWAETDWRVLGCECGAVTVRPRISSNQAGFWEVDPMGSFRAVQPLVVTGGGPASDHFHADAKSTYDFNNPDLTVGGTWSAAGDSTDFAVKA